MFRRPLVPLGERVPRAWEDFYKEMDSVVQQFFGGDEGRTAADRFTPHLNVAETEQAYEISLDLPGIDPSQVNVEMNDGQLTITGQKQQRSEEEGKTFLRVERQFGQFRRTIGIPAAVNEEGIHAEYKDGVLTVTIPKSEKAKPRRIEVRT